jgi:hypothetical protein
MSRTIIVSEELLMHISGIIWTVFVTQLTICILVQVVIYIIS